MSAKGGKNSDERLTILFCCSATGEKLKPLVIGVAENPRCFKGVDKNNLSVNWLANRKVWMTSAIFSDWLEELNRQMRRQRRHILLFMDNAASHISDTYSNVIIKFFPPNTTSILQPLEQGIIRSFKARFRLHMMNHLITRIDECNQANDLVKQITVLDAIHWIVRSWRETKVSTITKSFQRCGFDVSTDEEEDDLSLAKLIKSLVLSSNTSEEDFINFDNEIPTECDEEEKDEHVTSNEDKDEDDTVSTDLTYAKCLHMLHDIKTFAQIKDVGLVESIQSLEDQFQESALRYSKQNQKQSTR
ncbi:tigger transposable element-derived protein 6 isoform X2 [Patella vulgata]|nr:tigger transposable element-derived protein 6 isoform X2 [Patella vulgata]